MSGSSVAERGGSVATEQDVLLPANFGLFIEKEGCDGLIQPEPSFLKVEGWLKQFFTEELLFGEHDGALRYLWFSPPAKGPAKA